MPIIAAVVGAILSGLVYWFRYGDGMAQIDCALADRRNAKRRAESEAAFRAAPVRAIRNPIDAAGVLMYRVALARGTPTPEQEAAIEAELRAIVPPGDDLATRMTYIRHAAHQVADTDTALGHLAPLLRQKLTASELADLERMLANIAAIHQGPIPVQESLLARTRRSLIQTE
ncbi:hypothetical protein SAMN05216360_12243 [Methylobacterium phyllostachyos]|uniref:Tellurite resistance protein TerB n=2 Tax=Methylobacterium phyllostachyos TaxID=582672 RepID=A0A1H0JEY8_9HYPH|nr:hypothetical protein SAMN05216360_12243 [Methylobacterium phyllostachyos]